MFQTQVAWPYQSSAVQSQPVPSGTANTVVPVVDVFETSEEIVYIFEMPGINKEELEVEIENANILIAAPILSINPQEAVYRYQERPKGQIARSITLANDADPENCTANLKNGLLELRFRKKTQEQQGKKINVGLDT